jgi:hypothetical protein
MSPVSIFRSATPLCPARAIGFARHQREVVPEELAQVQVAGVEGERDQRDVEAARAQPLEQDLGDVLAQVELQIAVGAPQAGSTRGSR